MPINETFRKELLEKIKTFKKSYDLCGVEFTYIDPEFGKTTRSLLTSSPYSWYEYEVELLEIIEKYEILSYSFDADEIQKHFPVTREET